MALKATVFKAQISLSDMDRNVYQDFSLTLARHPSETDERMMIASLPLPGMRLNDWSLPKG